MKTMLLTLALFGAVFTMPVSAKCSDCCGNKCAECCGDKCSDCKGCK